MIKRKTDVNNDATFEEACENNDIMLTAKETNLNPVSYIDLKGNERKLDAKFSANNIIKDIESEYLKEVVDFNVGDIVRVYSKSEKGISERVPVFEGVVLKRQGVDADETFTVRKNSNGVGVEKTWFIHSPNIEKIEVICRGKVRRAKLNHLRNHVGKKGKIKELME